jgi:tricorn protease
MALLINENSFSDAEIFPTLFKQLKLGVVIGMPTSGSVIGTGHYRFMEGSSMRMPSTGWFTPTGKNMEGNGAIPDIFVDPTPQQVINDDDVQLKRAVEELLKTL